MGKASLSFVLPGSVDHQSCIIGKKSSSFNQTFSNLKTLFPHKSRFVSSRMDSGFLKTERKSRVVVEPGIVEKRKVGYLKEGFRYCDVDETAFEVGNVNAKREERRERQRQKRALQVEKVKTEIGAKEEEEYRGVQIRTAPLNLFPGRESLLRKIRRHD